MSKFFKAKRALNHTYRYSSPEMVNRHLVIANSDCVTAHRKSSHVYNEDV